MKTRISSTEAARNLGEYLARVRLRGERFILMKNRRPVAQIGPVAGIGSGTLGDLWEALREAPVDRAFADDLDTANATDRPAENPWP